MPKSIMWRLILLGFFFVVAVVLFLPSTPLSKSLPSWWKDKFPKIALGLDLQGGMHLVLQVDTEKAVESHVQRISKGVEALFREKGILFSGIKTQGNEIIIAYPNSDAKAAVMKAIGDNYPIFDKVSESEQEIKYTASDSEAKKIKEWSTSQAIETIRNRIDKFGVAEPLIQAQGKDEIVVQLPGLKDPDRAIALIGKTAVLEFKLVDEGGDLKKALDGQVPDGDELLYEKDVDKETGAVRQTPYLIKKEAVLTGDLLTDARVAIDSQFNEPYVSLTFDREGARIFENITAQNVNKRMAIILDGTVYSAPVIREKIGGGRAQISGNFTHDTAKDLAIVLRAGALPAPVNIIQNVTVGPSLGEDSIKAGVKAAIVGAILVLGFMLIYYRLSGLIADFAMVINIAMLLGAMAWFNATLTLPGIAGIILTIGMGVDSNVLIFERIKEELRTGRTVRSAIDAGYDRAWWTIIDSHVTTLITAAVLFQFGSGPIKGFAITLSIGILINLFTALVGTKVVYDMVSHGRRLERLSI
ncbi:MAG: protein-export membrane protein SecD [Deltaproteobacteria bacterium GWC2_42_51]|nr:MAG: protein-export membrane protein SecD [Deltaproteobacteria bacterium GWA2_42_85]OGP33564.1 MAG: protein-export membrane protein SecD [Deltaproteobacteria bacterium GWC2_42_51]OGP40870.1 MAG: protein-export membrane protein SecD [Deltaproteobacteria bacterium GWD2_42_10]OGP46869.1 MAG: protein-export membrane protein SecD [Deltaproteobacteria bacterium GWF2_42_12]OGQ25800.1 MAG: protein-export membrane protein SecD [Deltaproteobacteria bacterium RIFCSPHIGHO2_02_FULL_42_44]OGQ37771.1 MAG: